MKEAAVRIKRAVIRKRMTLFGRVVMVIYSVVVVLDNKLASCV
jgi:hypothetical protein